MSKRPASLFSVDLVRPAIHASFTKLQIDAEEPLPLAADGEPLAPARHVTVRVGAGLLPVVPGVGFTAAPTR